MFSLTVKSTRGDTTHVDVSPTMTVAELKAQGAEQAQALCLAEPAAERAERAQRTA